MFRRKKKVSKEAYKNLQDYVRMRQELFLAREHGFTNAVLEKKSGYEFCEECGNKSLCSTGDYPKCL